MGYPLDPLHVRDLQQEELKANKSKLAQLLADPKSKYKLEKFSQVELIMYKSKIYVPRKLQGRLLAWYHKYLCHPGGDRLAQTLKQVCYWKGMTSQAIKYCKRCPVCQKFKK